MSSTGDVAKTATVLAQLPATRGLRFPKPCFVKNIDRLSYAGRYMQICTIRKQSKRLQICCKLTSDQKPPQIVGEVAAQ